MTPAGATMSLKGEWAVARQIGVEVAFFSALDKYYRLAEGYPEPGRTVTATVRFKYCPGTNPDRRSTC